jgi:hypothetical protein
MELEETKNGSYGTFTNDQNSEIISENVTCVHSIFGAIILSSICFGINMFGLMVGVTFDLGPCYNNGTLAPLSTWLIITTSVAIPNNLVFLVLCILLLLNRNDNVYGPDSPGTHKYIVILSFILTSATVSMSVFGMNELAQQYEPCSKSDPIVSNVSLVVCVVNVVTVIFYMYKLLFF